MPFSYRIDPELQLAFLYPFGDITGADLLAELLEVVDGPGWQPGFARLWDFSEVTNLRLSREEARQFEEALREEPCSARATALVVHQTRAYQAALLFQVKVRQWPVKVFWTTGDALAWIARAEPVERLK